METHKIKNKHNNRRKEQSQFFENYQKLKPDQSQKNKTRKIKTKHQKQNTSNIRVSLHGGLHQ